MAAWRIEQKTRGRGTVGSPPEKLNCGRQDIEHDGVIVPLTVTDNKVTIHLAEIVGDPCRVYATPKQILASNLTYLAELPVN